MKRYSVLIVPALLAACSSMVVSLPTGPDEYTISAQPPEGTFSELLGTNLSEAKIESRADSLCPRGYDVLDKQQGQFESEYVRWKIRCRAKAS